MNPHRPFFLRPFPRSHAGSCWLRPFPRVSGGRTGWGRWGSLLLLLFVASHAFAEAPHGYIAQPLEPGVAYNQRARDAYAAGSWTLDEIAATDAKLSPSDMTSIYERARTAFEEAVLAEPAMYEAHTYLGYIHRKLGRYDRSLEAYATALKLKPDFVYAIEYQGEAYLGLGDFNNARFNYLRLYALDQALAAKLLDAMSDWSLAPTESRSKDIERKDIESARAWIAVQKARGSR